MEPQKLLAEFEHKGFVCLPNLIDDPALLGALRTEYDREYESESGGFHNIATGDPEHEEQLKAQAALQAHNASAESGQELGMDRETVEGRAKEVMLQRINMCEVSMPFRQLLFSDRVLDIAELLIGSPSIQLFHDQALYKPARGSDGTYGGNMQWQYAPPDHFFVLVRLREALILCPRSRGGPSAFAQR